MNNPQYKWKGDQQCSYCHQYFKRVNHHIPHCNEYIKERNLKYFNSGLNKGKETNTQNIIYQDNRSVTVNNILIYSPIVNNYINSVDKFKNDVLSYVRSKLPLYLKSEHNLTSVITFIRDLKADINKADKESIETLKQFEEITMKVESETDDKAGEIFAKKIDDTEIEIIDTIISMLNHETATEMMTLNKSKQLFAFDT